MSCAPACCGRSAFVDFDYRDSATQQPNAEAGLTKPAYIVQESDHELPAGGETSRSLAPIISAAQRLVTGTSCQWNEREAQYASALQLRTQCGHDNSWSQGPHR
jgi:hypothetical protein